MKNNNPKVTNELGRGQRATVKANKAGKDTLGGLVLRAINGPHAGVEFRCGSGFSAEDRAILWQASLLGEVCKIKAFPVGVKDKPRHPIFLGFRDMEVDG